MTVRVRVGVTVRVRVGVTVRVRVGDGVAVRLGVTVAVRVRDGTGVAVGADVGVRVAVTLAVRVTDGVVVGVAVTVVVRVGEAVAVAVRVRVVVGTDVCVGVAVRVPTVVGVRVPVPVGVPAAMSARIWVAARVPERYAPWTVAKYVRCVASPAKKILPPIGCANVSRIAGVEPVALYEYAPRLNGSDPHRVTFEATGAGMALPKIVRRTARAASTMAASVLVSMAAPYWAALNPTRIGRPAGRARLIQSTHSPRRGVTYSIQSVDGSQKTVGKTRVHRFSTPIPNPPMAACWMAGRAGAKVTAPDFSTPRGRVTTTRSATSVELAPPVADVAAMTTVFPAMETFVTLCDRRMSSPRANKSGSAPYPSGRTWSTPGKATSSSNHQVERASLLAAYSCSYSVLMR